MIVKEQKPIENMNSDELREKFKKSGLVLQWQESTGVPKELHNECVDVLVRIAMRHFQAKLQAIKESLPEEGDVYEHLNGKTGRVLFIEGFNAAIGQVTAIIDKELELST